MFCQIKSVPACFQHKLKIVNIQYLLNFGILIQILYQTYKWPDSKYVAHAQTFLFFAQGRWHTENWVRSQNYRWQNGKQYKGKTNSGQSALAQRVRQSCTGWPPPTPLLHRVAVKQHYQNFVEREIVTKLFWILQNWRKIVWNTKLKMLWNHKKQIFLQPP